MPPISRLLKAKQSPGGKLLCNTQVARITPYPKKKKILAKDSYKKQKKEDCSVIKKKIEVYIKTYR
jgi:hypothetical protein